MSRITTYYQFILRKMDFELIVYFLLDTQKNYI